MTDKNALARKIVITAVWAVAAVSVALAQAVMTRFPSQWSLAEVITWFGVIAAALALIMLVGWRVTRPGSSS